MDFLFGVNQQHVSGLMSRGQTHRETEYAKRNQLQLWAPTAPPRWRLLGAGFGRVLAQRLSGEVTAKGHRGSWWLHPVFTPAPSDRGARQSTECSGLAGQENSQALASRALCSVPYFDMFLKKRKRQKKQNKKTNNKT